MTKLFTSDTHFSSERTLKLSRRPFIDINDMNRFIISRANAIIDKFKLTDGNDDVILYHLGDFGDYNFAKEYHCPVILVIGNYEENEIKEINGDDLTDEMKFNLFKYKLIHDYGFKDVVRPGINMDLDCNINDSIDQILKLTLVHKPLDFLKISKETNIKHYRWCLFGHIHEKQKIKKFGINVGVDCNNFYPMTADDIGFYLNGIENFYDDEVFC